MKRNLNNQLEFIAVQITILNDRINHNQMESRFHVSQLSFEFFLLLFPKKHPVNFLNSLWLLLYPAWYPVILAQFNNVLYHEPNTVGINGICKYKRKRMLVRSSQKVSLINSSEEVYFNWAITVKCGDGKVYYDAREP